MADLTPPRAEVREHVREHHGDRVLDPYEWLRDGDDPDVLAYLDAENAYAEARTAGLQPLRDSIFGEIKSRVLETDLSVPVRSGPWWYYSRTVEGQQYSIHARVPVTDPAVRPAVAPDEIAADEQVLLDGNVEAGDSEFFSVGALTVSADHSRLAFATDTTGDERFDLVLALTNGGPAGSTSVAAFYMYQTAFEDLRLGRASAAAFILFVIIFALTLVQLRVFRRGGIESY